MKKSKNIIVISPYVKKERTTCDCPSYVYRFNVLGFYKPSFTQQKYTIELFNDTEFIIEPHATKILPLNVFITTSMPCVCIVYGSPYLYFSGVSCAISQTKTNDEPLTTTLCNLTSKTLTFKPDSLTFYCLILNNNHSHHEEPILKN